MEDDFLLAHNTGMFPDGCLVAPLYGQIKPDQIFNWDSHVTSRPSHLAQQVWGVPTRAQDLKCAHCQSHGGHLLDIVFHN